MSFFWRGPDGDLAMLCPLGVRAAAMVSARAAEVAGGPAALASARHLRFLRAALALSSGSAMSVLEGDRQGDLGKLIESAGLGELAPHTHPSCKLLKAFADWVGCGLHPWFSWSGCLRGRILAASVLNHVESVARLAADAASLAAQAEKRAIAYDQLFRSTAWTAAMRKADPQASTAAMRGDKEDP
ncbi:unnamed protein product, partial [Prorocentrum cordatum]